MFLIAQNEILRRLQRTLIDHDRYLYLLGGLRRTLVITLCAALIGFVIGLIAATVKTKRRTGFFGRAAALLADLYLTVVRGTPMAVQLLIIYYVIFINSSLDRLAVAIIAFGINSGAYTAEIIRAGILSVEKGQTEAGRSLGFSPFGTMRYIVMPQALKNAIPNLCNEIIILLKETSIVGFIGVVDLTTAAMYIRAATYDSYTPLLTIMVVYLAMVIGLTAVLRRVERRLRRGDSH